MACRKRKTTSKRRSKAVKHTARKTTAKRRTKRRSFWDILWND